MSGSNPMPDLDARKQAAGKFGFVLGCVAAVAALSINLYRSRPLGVTSVVIAVLMSALNVPIGIALGLLAERLTRPKP